MRLLALALLVAVAFSGCAALQRAGSSAVTRGADGELSPLEQIGSGAVRVVSHPVDLLGWGEIAAGVGAIVAAAVGGGAAVNHRAKKRERRLVHAAAFAERVGAAVAHPDKEGGPA